MAGLSDSVEGVKSSFRQRAGISNLEGERAWISCFVARRPQAHLVGLGALTPHSWD